MNLNDQLLELVKKNLPEATAGELKKFIEQANTNEVALLDARKAIERHEPLLKEREKLVAEKAAVESKAAANAGKQAELEAKETALKLSEKDQKIAALTEVNNNMYTIMQLFVKNPRSIEIMNHYQNESQQGYPGPNGSWIYPTPINRSETKETEKKEVKDLNINN